MEAPPTSTASTTALRVVVGIWAWADTLAEIERRLISFGVRRRDVRSRWRGLSVEIRMEVDGTAAQLLGFTRFVESLSA